MEEKRYLIADGNYVVARDMGLGTALLLLKALCEEYGLEDNSEYILRMETNTRD